MRACGTLCNEHGLSALMGSRGKYQEREQTLINPVSSGGHGQHIFEAIAKRQPPVHLEAAEQRT